MLTQAKVPKFLDIEDKIIGPLSLRQFLIFATAATLIFIFSLFIKIKPILWIIGFVITVTAFATAFVRLNERPFHIYVLALLTYYLLAPKKYVWEKVPSRVKMKTPEIKKPAPVQLQPGQRLTRSAIRELAKQLDLYHQTKRINY